MALSHSDEGPRMFGNDEKRGVYAAFTPLPASRS